VDPAGVVNRDEVELELDHILDDAGWPSGWRTIFSGRCELVELERYPESELDS
jgi:hypothetical protein